MSYSDGWAIGGGRALLDQIGNYADVLLPRIAVGRTRLFPGVSGDSPQAVESSEFP